MSVWDQFETKGPVDVPDVHYRPPWYPNRDPRHNPWASNGQTGAAEKSLYEEWTDSLPPGELLRLIEEYQRSWVEL